VGRSSREPSAKHGSFDGEGRWVAAPWAPGSAIAGRRIAAQRLAATELQRWQRFERTRSSAEAWAAVESEGCRARAIASSSSYPRILARHTLVDAAHLIWDAWSTA
jgi:hypothetical protein